VAITYRVLEVRVEYAESTNEVITNTLMEINDAGDITTQWYQTTYADTDAGATNYRTVWDAATGGTPADA
jgi:hypothetical protein